MNEDIKALAWHQEIQASAGNAVKQFQPVESVVFKFSWIGQNALGSFRGSECPKEYFGSFISKLPLGMVFQTTS